MPSSQQVKAQEEMLIKYLKPTCSLTNGKLSKNQKSSRASHHQIEMQNILWQKKKSERKKRKSKVRAFVKIAYPENGTNSIHSSIEPVARLPRKSRSTSQKKPKRKREFKKEYYSDDQKPPAKRTKRNQQTSDSNSSSYNPKRRKAIKEPRIPVASSKKKTPATPKENKSDSVVFKKKSPMTTDQNKRPAKVSIPIITSRKENPKPQTPKLRLKSNSGPPRTELHKKPPPTNQDPEHQDEVNTVSKKGLSSTRKSTKTQIPNPSDKNKSEDESDHAPDSNNTKNVAVQPKKKKTKPQSRTPPGSHDIQTKKKQRKKAMKQSLQAMEYALKMQVDAMTSSSEDSSVEDKDELENQLEYTQYESSPTKNQNTKSQEQTSVSHDRKTPAADKANTTTQSPNRKVTSENKNVIEVLSDSTVDKAIPAIEKPTVENIQDSEQPETKVESDREIKPRDDDLNEEENDEADEDDGQGDD